MELDGDLLHGGTPDLAKDMPDPAMGSRDLASDGPQRRSDRHEREQPMGKPTVHRGGPRRRRPCIGASFLVHARSAARRSEVGGRRVGAAVLSPEPPLGSDADGRGLFLCSGYMFWKHS
jgi:hypothetical protein